MAAVTIFIIVAMILLFISMVLSAIAADNISNKNYDTGRKYSMISAVVSGVSVAILIVVLILYLNSGKIVTHVRQGLQPYEN